MYDLIFSIKGCGTFLCQVLKFHNFHVLVGPVLPTEHSEASTPGDLYFLLWQIFLELSHSLLPSLPFWKSYYFWLFLLHVVCICFLWTASDFAYTSSIDFIISGTMSTNVCLFLSCILFPALRWHLILVLWLQYLILESKSRCFLNCFFSYYFILICVFATCPLSSVYMVI